MKKTTTLSILILFFAITAFAGPVDPEKALEIANSFWKSIPELKQSELLLLPVGPSKSAGRDGVHKADAQYYLFAPEDKGGFVIVSGEDCLSPVVGYSASTVAGEMPPALVDWLADYSCFVDDVRAGVIEPAPKVAAGGTRIEPMLKTSWNQGIPYNNLCPTVGGQRTPTGCTATAMAQIMKFHEWPEKATCDIVWHNNITNVDETVALTSHTYQWSYMLEHYRGGYASAHANAVAQLMVDVGKAIGSSYALEGTGSSEEYVSYALVNIFDYSPDVAIVRRSEYTNDEYISIIRENLEARQPLLYTGMSQSYGSGHAFVCDGIDENNMLHIDWGWDGAYNGYFDMTYMSPSGVGIGGGDGRYNVGQTLVANIRPRNNELDTEGVPNVYLMDVVDANADLNAGRPKTLLEQTVSFVEGIANIRIAAGLLNISHSSVDLSMIVGFEKDGELVSASRITDVGTMEFNGDLGYYLTLPISSNPSNQNYLEAGTYTLSMYYGDADDNLYNVRGAENGLRLEVADTKVRISKILPEIEVTETTFHATPSAKGDRIALDAKFRSNNGRSATVLIAPVLNKVLPGGGCESTVLSDDAVLIQVHDDEEIFATFDSGSTIPGDGEYFISFKYNMRNEYYNHSMEVDKSQLVDIKGKSGSFVVEALPDGAVPSLTAISAVSVAWGEELQVSATVKNIASTDDAYSGTLALFAEDVSTAEKHMLMTGEIIGLEQDADTVIQYKAADYFPVLRQGNYIVFVCERKDGQWKKIRQSAPLCHFNITAGSVVLPYANARYSINGGAAVRQGSEFNVVMELICAEGDYDGYIKVSNKVGVSNLISSDYIPVSLKKGVPSEVVVPCTCNSKAPLKQYRLNVNCYDSGKNKIGVLSHNTVTYPDNGYFWVADVTAVDNPQAEEVAVIVENGCITVDGASAVKVMCLDGRTLYSGNAASVAVENGVYVVVVEGTDGNVAVKKVLVK
ncbi:MAG: C10 family peptidase [Bacteroidaceae bacterium]|nr:C10 family peptidase [Bacteroidaceae bacterium]